MKRKFLALLLVLAALLGISTAASAAGSSVWAELYTMGDPANPATKILASQVDSGTVFFLPASADLKAVPIYFNVGGVSSVTAVGSKGSVTLKSGDTLDLTRICGGSSYSVTLNADSAPSLGVTFIRSDNVAAMYLASDDPVSHGRTWVEASYSKENKATGSMIMVDPDGSSVYAGGLTQIKGRGNTTWLAAKRPYQIKLESKSDLLETGASSNRAKTWILLANYYDPSYLRNAVTLELGRALGLDYSIEQRSVALYYDGEYRGLYLLTEKVEIKSGRVDLPSLEDANEKANPDIPDAEALPQAIGYTGNGCMYAYREGLKSPADISGGYLLEMDMSGRATDEASYFRTTRGNYVTVKSPEFASGEEMAYIAALYQEMEDALYNGGVNPDTGRPLSDYLDLHSSAQVYLIQELTKNQDAFASSAFLYKRPDSDALYMGPLWDFDLCLGNTSMKEANQPDDWVPLYHGVGKALNQLQDFRQLVHDVYFDELLPLLNDLNSSGFEAMAEEIRPAALASQMLWNFSSANYPKDDRIFLYGSPKNWKDAADYLGSFLKNRTAWLEEKLAAWGEEPPIETPAFIDVSPSAWYYKDIYKAYELGLMKGIGYARFNPEGLTTRAEPVQVLFNLSGEKKPAYSPVYRDVSANVWYTGPILWATARGIVRGTPEGCFYPRANLTRQDLVTILYRAAGSPAADTSILTGYGDVRTVSKYAASAMAWAVENGIIRGKTSTLLAPLDAATRAELATVMVRYYKLFS